jgi:hypothetical protein
VAVVPRGPRGSHSGGGGFKNTLRRIGNFLFEGDPFQVPVEDMQDDYDAAGRPLASLRLDGGPGAGGSPRFGPAALSLLGPQGTMNQTGIGALNFERYGPSMMGLRGPGGTQAQTGVGRLGAIGSRLMGGAEDPTQAAPAVRARPTEGIDKWLERGALATQIGAGVTDFFNERSDRKRREEEIAKEEEERKRRAEIFGRALSGTYGSR